MTRVKRSMVTVVAFALLVVIPSSGVTAAVAHSDDPESGSRKRNASWQWMYARSSIGLSVTAGAGSYDDLSGVSVGVDTSLLVDPRAAFLIAGSIEYGYGAALVRLDGEQLWKQAGDTRGDGTDLYTNATRWRAVLALSIRIGAFHNRLVAEPEIGYAWIEDKLRIEANRKTSHFEHQFGRGGYFGLRTRVDILKGLGVAYNFSYAGYEVIERRSEFMAEISSDSFAGSELDSAARTHGSGRLALGLGYHLGTRGDGRRVSMGLLRVSILGVF